MYPKIGSLKNLSLIIESASKNIVCVYLVPGNVIEVRKNSNSVDDATYLFSVSLWFLFQVIYWLFSVTSEYYLVI